MDSPLKTTLKDMTYILRIKVVKDLLESGLITKVEGIEIIYQITPEQAEQKLKEINQ